MNKATRLLTAISLVTGLVFAAPGLAAIKCWTSKDGVRECGDAVPPEYAQQENRTVNKRGITVDVQQRAKTGAELEAEMERKKAEAERAAEEKRQREAQIKADRILLATFTSENDIIMARDRKIGALEGTIEATQLSLTKQEKKMAEYQKRVASLEGSGKPVPDDLRSDVTREQQQLDKKAKFLAAREAEVAALRAEYEGYLARYREIMQRNGN